MQFALNKPTRRKPSLTPMIDVVFLLLVFFMLASRFGLDQVLPLPLAAGGGEYSGPPRLVDVLPTAVRLNGIDYPEASLPDELKVLTSGVGDTIVIRSSEGATVQRLVTISEILRRAGFTSIVLVE